MVRMLMSIRPEFVDLILAGEKRFEFRRSRCRKPVESIVIYASAPRQLVVGEVEVLDILEDNVEAVWAATRDYAGLSWDRFAAYYQGKDTATAYVLGQVTPYPTPFPLSDLGIHKAPQSFQYLPNDERR